MSFFISKSFAIFAVAVTLSSLQAQAKEVKVVYLYHNLNKDTYQVAYDPPPYLPGPDDPTLPDERAIPFSKVDWQKSENQQALQRRLDAVIKSGVPIDVPLDIPSNECSQALRTALDKNTDLTLTVVEIPDKYMRDLKDADYPINSQYAPYMYMPLLLPFDPLNVTLSNSKTGAKRNLAAWFTQCQNKIGWTEFKRKLEKGKYILWAASHATYQYPNEYDSSEMAHEKQIRLRALESKSSQVAQSYLQEALQLPADQNDQKGTK